jgi:hypothetical protein
MSGSHGKNLLRRVKMQCKERILPEDQDREYIAGPSWLDELFEIDEAQMKRQ